MLLHWPNALTTQIMKKTFGRVKGVTLRVFNVTRGVGRAASATALLAAKSIQLCVVPNAELRDTRQDASVTCLCPIQHAAHPSIIQAAASFRGFRASSMTQSNNSKLPLLDASGCSPKLLLGITPRPVCQGDTDQQA